MHEFIYTLGVVFIPFASLLFILLFTQVLILVIHYTYDYTTLLMSFPICVAVWLPQRKCKSLLQVSRELDSFTTD